MSAGGCRATRAHLTMGNRKHRQPQQGQGRTARVALPCGHVRVTRMDWAASETRSFRARSDMLLTMTHSRQILAHRPCDKETDTQRSNSRVPITQPAGCLARTMAARLPFAGRLLPQPVLPPSSAPAQRPADPGSMDAEPPRPHQAWERGRPGREGQAMLSLPEGPASTGSVV